MSNIVNLQFTQCFDKAVKPVDIILCMVQYVMHKTILFMKNMHHAAVSAMRVLAEIELQM